MNTNELAPTANAPPQPAEYAPEIIQKSIMNKVLTHPLTLYPSATGIGLALAGFIAHVPICYPLALVGLVGPLWAVVQLCFRNDTLISNHIGALNQKREEYKQGLMKRVKTGLNEAYDTALANEHSRQGGEQFDRVALVRDGILELLQMKVGSHELTYHRFLGAAEQAYLSILDNLRDVVAGLKSINSIDPDELRRKIERTERCRKASAADKEELNALKERLKIWESQMERVDGLLAKNEKVITSMELISSRISEWQTEQSFSASDLESTINELQELADFAHKLNNSIQM